MDEAALANPRVTNKDDLEDSLYLGCWGCLCLSVHHKKGYLAFFYHLCLLGHHKKRQVPFGMLWFSLLVHHKKDQCYLACCGYLCQYITIKTGLIWHAVVTSVCQYITSKTGMIWHAVVIISASTLPERLLLFGILLRRWMVGVGAASGNRI